MVKNKYRLVAGAIFALALSACGGGGGSSPASAQSGTTSDPVTQAPATAYTDWAFHGSAPTVTGVGGLVAVVLAPDTLTSNSVSGTMFTASNAPLTKQIQQANYGGAFTTLGSPSLTVALTKGSTIADVNGAGGYVAIGRWTHGSDSSGGNYNANQGAHYAVGNPLTLTAGAGTLTCSALMSTAPTSASGSVAPGSLQSATATIDLATLSINNFTATVTIGTDNAASFTKATSMLSGSAMGGGVTLVTQLMGNDATKPLVAVAYGAHLANTGEINGLVVLSCQ